MRQAKLKKEVVKWIKKSCSKHGDYMTIPEQLGCFVDVKFGKGKVCTKMYKIEITLLK